MDGRMDSGTKWLVGSPFIMTQNTGPSRVTVTQEKVPAGKYLGNLNKINFKLITLFHLGGLELPYTKFT